VPVAAYPEEELPLPDLGEGVGQALFFDGFGEGTVDKHHPGFESFFEGNFIGDSLVGEVLMLFDVAEQFLMTGTGEIGGAEMNGIQREPPWFSFNVLPREKTSMHESENPSRKM
jgi:hypothetical protein